MSSQSQTLAGSAAMFAPDGSVRLIPNEQVADALKNGGKLAVPMTSPKGETHWIPSDQVGEAQQAGGKVDWSNVPQAQKEGWKALPKDLLGMAHGIVGMMAGGPANVPSMVMEQAAQTGVDDFQRRQEGRSLAYRIAAPIAQNTTGVNARGMEEAANEGDTAGVLGHAAAPVVAAGIVKGASKVAPKVGSAVDAVSPRGVMSKRMAEVPSGEQFSRGEVLDAAQQHGVNLDVAQATDSGTAGALKKANRYSLASQGVYDANTTKNVGALQQWADGELNRYSPVSAEREVVGGQLQQQLRSHLEARKNLATNTFKELDGDVGSNTIDATGTIEAEARKIVSENKEYYAKHPELKPTKAWNILENLAERPKVNTVNPKATAPGLMDVNGQPVSATGTITKQPAQVHTFTWSELHQLRSDLMDFYRNNPDVVKGRSEAWIQQMVANIDNAMTDASAGLSGEQLAKFRQANQVWESIKNTYDNPQSPYYHAVRAQYASQVPGMLSKATPELARQVRDTLGNLEGPFQRQFVENLISDKSGNLDLGKLDMKLSRIPNDHLVAMIGEDGARQLKLLGKVAKKVGYDLNPSGTAKVGVPATEIGGLLNPSTTLPTAGELFLQRLGAKAMNSPSLVNFLTKARP